MLNNKDEHNSYPIAFGANRKKWAPPFATNLDLFVRLTMQRNYGISRHEIEARNTFVARDDEPTRDWLRRLGFTEVQLRLLPCLAMATHGIDGQETGYILSSMQPEKDASGRLAFNLMNHWPYALRRQIDVSPLVRNWVLKGREVLVVALRPMDADSATSAGIAAISLNGAFDPQPEDFGDIQDSNDVNDPFNRAQQPQKSPQGRFDALVSDIVDPVTVDPVFPREIPLEFTLEGEQWPREVICVVDSDLIPGDTDYQAMANFQAAVDAIHSECYFKCIWTQLPPGPNGKKMTLVDFFLLGGTLHDLFMWEPFVPRAP